MVLEWDGWTSVNKWLKTWFKTILTQKIHCILLIHLLTLKIKVKKEDIRTNNIIDKKTKRDMIKCSHYKMVENSLKMKSPNMISMEIYRVDFSLLNIATAIHILEATGQCVTQTLKTLSLPQIATKKPWQMLVLGK